MKSNRAGTRLMGLLTVIGTLSLGACQPRPYDVRPYQTAQSYGGHGCDGSYQYPVLPPWLTRQLIKEGVGYLCGQAIADAMHQYGYARGYDYRYFGRY
jgi:hypothetical protein